ncbi:EAL domain-containing protein [Mesorhizobium sp. CAU 1732]|uniref:EAL domain-containing protein n=1 Tax=Mesorhizobium sp. CAU 1732 TaxID=3140358 RepID=UPI003261ABD3
MSRSVWLAHIIRHDDRTTTGVWGVYTLKSAFQPIFGFHDGKLTVDAFEGLIRPDRNGDSVSPDTFFRSIPAGDRLHVETLTRTLHLLNAGAFLDPATQLFINFDPSIFGERDIAEIALRDMRLTLHEAGIDPRRVVCEVTEQKTNSQQALNGFVAALRDHGLRIAVDDYGAEDSDMERVTALKPDIVKFDAQWITRLMDSRPGFALLKVMVDQFAARGIKTVFEGIEEPWQLELAEESGAHMVQGYILARPEIAPTSFSSFRREGETPAARQPYSHDNHTAVHGGEAPGFGDRPALRSAVPVRKTFGRRPSR